MKELYTFTIKGENGKTRKFMVARPTRRQIEEAETEYAVEMSNCVRKGILTKNMLAKKYADTGGVLSEETAKELNRYYHELNQLTSEHSRLKTLKSKTKKTKSRLQEIEEKIVNIRRDIVDIESANLSLFNNTAESRAQSKVITWYAVNLTYEEKDEEWQQYFEGDTFEDKEEFYYNKEDSEDTDYFKMVQKVGTVVAFWFFNQGVDREEFDSLLKEFVEDKTDETSQEPDEVDQDEARG